MDLVLKIAAALAILLVGLSMFPGLSWLLKIRVLAAVLLGIIVMGLWAWPIVAPAEPFGIVSAPDAAGFMLLMALAAGTGFAGYFITWPYGTYIGVIAVPGGMAVWALRSASMADVLAGIANAAQRTDFFRSLPGESFLWLLIAAGGFAGACLGRCVLAPAAAAQVNHTESKQKLNRTANTVIAVVASSVIAFLAVTLFAQDVKLPDSRVGYVIAQPSTGQIAFAAFAAFGLAAFIVKEFLGAGYIWAAVSTACVSALGLGLAARPSVTEYLAGNWPADFFAGCHGAILPLQMVSFGVLGAIAGCWLAGSFEIWRREQHQQGL